MAGTHGELFSEIGAMVVAAHSGEVIDLRAKSEELADRYKNLGVGSDTMARAIARSASAVGVSMAMMQIATRGDAEALTPLPAMPRAEPQALGDAFTAEDADKAPGTLFPSGVRLAVLS